jgi:hypothetical protein
LRTIRRPRGIFVSSVDTGDPPVVGNGTASAGDNTTRVPLAALEGQSTGTTHQIDEQFIEVIAFSAAKQANVFYKFFDDERHPIGRRRSSRRRDTLDVADNSLHMRVDCA